MLALTLAYFAKSIIHSRRWSVALQESSLYSSVPLLQFMRGLGFRLCGI